MTGKSKLKSPWNSLEVMKLLVSAALPIILLYLGASLKSQQDQLAKQQALDAQALQKQQVILERLAQWRYEKYDRAAGLLNDMYAYYIYVGKWKELTPQNVIERKREIDKIFYSTGPLFSEALMSRYNALIREMFKHYQGWGEDAKIRSSFEHRKEAAKAIGMKWNNEWDQQFTDEDNRTKIKTAYKALTEQLAVDLNIIPAGRVH